MRLLTFFDGGEIFVMINGFHFASNVPHLIGIWTKPQVCEISQSHTSPQIPLDLEIKSHHDTLGNVSNSKTTLIRTKKVMKNLQGFN